MYLKDKNSIDSVRGELGCLKQANEEFWQSIQELMRYGVPAYDQRGHWAEIRIKVRPLQVDMIAAIREKMPGGWFKHMTSLHRAIIAVGCKVFLHLVDQEKGEWHEILDGLNEMAKKVRLEEFKKEMASLRGNIIDCGTMPPQEKLQIIQQLDGMETRFTAL